MSQTYLYFVGKTERKGSETKSTITSFGANGMCRKYALDFNFGLTFSIDSKTILYIQKKFNRWKTRNVSEEQDILLTPPKKKKIRKYSASSWLLWPI